MTVSDSVSPSPKGGGEPARSPSKSRNRIGRTQNANLSRPSARQQQPSSDKTIGRTAVREPRLEPHQCESGICKRGLTLKRARLECTEPTRWRSFLIVAAVSSHPHVATPVSVFSLPRQISTPTVKSGCRLQQNWLRLLYMTRYKCAKVGIIKQSCSGHMGPSHWNRKCCKIVIVIFIYV